MKASLDLKSLRQVICVYISGIFHRVWTWKFETAPRIFGIVGDFEYVINIYLPDGR